MLRTLLFAQTALLTVGKGLAALFEVFAHHVHGMVFQAVHVVVGPHFKNVRDVDFYRAWLAVFAAGAVQFGELLEVFHGNAKGGPFFFGEGGVIGSNLNVLLYHFKILHAGEGAV